MSTAIGILGGMGPRATVEFEQRLISSLTGGDQQLPKIFSINDGTIPDRTAFITNGGDDPVPRMQSNLVLLESMGAEIICIPCNTAHAQAIFGRLQASKSKLVNLPEIVLASIKEQCLSNPLLLATQGTVEAGVYGDIKTPDAATQKLVTNLIEQTKLGIKPGSKEIKKLKNYICQSGADCVILGCTELSIVAQELGCKIKVIDTLDVLVEELTKQGEKNE